MFEIVTFIFSVTVKLMFAYNSLYIIFFLFTDVRIATFNPLIVPE